MLGKLKDAIGKFARLGVSDKRAVEDLVRDIQRTLIQADVNVKLVMQLSEEIKKKALKEDIPKGISRKEHIVNIVYETLVEFLGKESHMFDLKKQKILLLGLFGSGKTTTTMKLGLFFKKKGLSVGVIGADVHRPAAYEQLKQNAERVKISFYGEKGNKNATEIVENGLKELKEDVIIVDSAGRSALDDDLIKELKEIDSVLKPKEKLLVISGDIGQAAQKQAEEFNKAVGLTGVIVTKMDSSAKGGGALTACAAANVPVRFLGVGEKAEDYEIYDPVRFVSRLLGMGDLQTLLEKAQEAISPEKAMKVLTEELTFETFYEQIESVKKMGSLSKILEMIPGMGKLNVPKEMIDIQEEKMKNWKIIIDSMNKQEKKDVDILDASRISRIAKGSGKTEEEVRELIKHFKQTKKMMKMFKGGKALKRGPMAQMMKNLKGF